MGCIVQLVMLAIGGLLAYGAHALGAPDIIVWVILLMFGGVVFDDHGPNFDTR